MSHTAIDTGPRDCTRHGPFTSTLWALTNPPKKPLWTSTTLAAALKPFWSQCPTCDAEMQREVDAKEAEIKGGVTAKQMAAAARVRALNIPLLFQNATIENFTHGIPGQRKAWEWAREYSIHFEAAIEAGRSAVFFGTMGTGKTHLAVGILRWIGEKGGTGHYCTAAELFERIRSSYHKDAKESEAAIVKALVAVDMLVVDEVGRSSDSDFERRGLFHLLDTRYRNMKPTIIISQLGRADVVRFLGDAIVDRVTERGGAFLAFEWASMRDPRAKRAEE